MKNRKIQGSHFLFIEQTSLLFFFILGLSMTHSKEYMTDGSLKNLEIMKRIAAIIKTAAVNQMSPY